ncbi:MAG: transglutaminase family protein [Verrucomicrobia bacterium]|nr:transglutaminase family protein [Verrucomicrobiota bacterium]
MNSTMPAMAGRRAGATRLRSLPVAQGLLLLLALGLAASPCATGEPAAPVGTCEHVYSLAAENTEVRGLAWDESASASPRLLVLDQSGKVFAYERRRGESPDSDTLSLRRTHDVSAAVGASNLTNPRGLCFAVENGRRVIYFADWNPSPPGPRSRLWRYVLGEAAASLSADLSRHPFRMGDREVYDLACEDGVLWVSYDASGHADPNLRVQRGILRIQGKQGWDKLPLDVRHMPDAGTFPARGLAAMRLEGWLYLWATVGEDHIYCAESGTGRGLFFFDRPQSHEKSRSCWGLGFGQDALWVPESVPGPDRVHRVNVTRNLDASFEGPRVLRHLTMTIETEPETGAGEPGGVYHYYSRPCSHEQMQNQGIWTETEKVADVSSVSNAVLRSFTHDPAGDASSRQTMHCVAYANAPARSYASRYDIDLWTRPWKKFVYPHRVRREAGPLEGAGYLADDPDLYSLRDTATYESFIQRTRAHIRRKYGVEADMHHPYWAARNIVEYIQDHYYYPNRDKGKPATVDYDRGHYDANPGNLKIALSARDYDKTQIIACSGTSVMVAGAMRHLGIPARWLGTGTPHSPGAWDRNGNGLLDPGETAPCSNGHRYDQVWLGSHYGWICFDATPSKPAFNDYDVPPPLQSQWRYMTRCASGHRAPRRIVFNIGSALFRPLYRDFEYDARLAVDNDCGGDQRYNLQGRYDKPDQWKLARHRIRLENLCFIQRVTVTDPGAKTRITWQRDGAWDRLPGATVSVWLQQHADRNPPWTDVARLAGNVPCHAGAIVADTSGHAGKSLRVIIRRDGDPETGGVSAPFRCPSPW